MIEKPLNIIMAIQNVPTMSVIAEALRSAGCLVTCLNSGFDSRETATTAFLEAIASSGAPDLIILSAAPDASLRTNLPLVELGFESWIEAADRPQRTMLYMLQAVNAARAGRGIAVVVIGATMGLTGAGNYCALATATEGQRGLMKSVARQLGPKEGDPGMRLNWVAVATTTLFPEIPQGDLIQPYELGAVEPPLGRRPTIEETAHTLMLLASPLANAVTGATINLDGGEWMLP